MLYKKNSEEKLSNELFKNPTCEFRGTPFWAWNSWLEKDELERQIEIFNEMGFGGFHMHVRTGLKNKYLSDEYMQLIRDCVDKAKSEKMLAWLYDEDRWPSGAAGGYVTEDERYRARYLLFTPFKTAEAKKSVEVSAGRTNNGKLLACYDVVLDKDGYLSSYKQIGEDDKAEGTKWYAFMEIIGESDWFNGSGMDLVGNLCQIVFAIAVGFLLVTIFYRGGSLLPCILVHSAINTLGTFANDANLTTEMHLLHLAALIVITVAYTLILTRTLTKSQWKEGCKYE